MKESRNISSNILYLFFDKVYGTIITLLFLSILTSYLGPELFGIWSYILSFASIAVPLSTVGTNYTIVKKFSLNQNPADVAKQAFLLRLLSSIATTLLLLLAFIAISKTASQKEKITLMFFLAAMILNNLNLSVLYNEYKIKNGKTVLAKNIGLTIGTSIKILLIYNNASIPEIAAVTILESLIFFLFGYYLTDLNISISFSTGVIADSRKLLIESFPLFLSSLIAVIYFKIDIIFLRYYAELTDVGYYASASRVSEMLYAAPVAICTVFFPVILKEINKNQLIFQSRNIFYSLIFFVCFTFSFLIYFNSEFIVEKLYGNQYLPAVEILQIHGFSILLIGFLISGNKELIAKGMYSLVYFKDVFGLISNIVLNIILIPKYAGFGAAISTLISYFLASIFSNLFFVETRKILFVMLKSPVIIFKNNVIKNA